MSVRCILQTVVFGMVFTIGLAAAQADVWDAYSQYNTVDNTTANVWQYLSVPEQTNTGYSLLPSYGWDGMAAQTGWFSGVGCPVVAKDASSLYVIPGPAGTAAVIGWKSPIAGTVNVEYSFSISALSYGERTYALFMEDASTPLQSAALLAGGASSGTITGTTSIASGKMLYLQVGPYELGGPHDFYFDDSHVSFSVTYVPEPSTLVLLTCGLIGLLAYAWRKPK
jgi:hypothetical protein